MNRTQEIIATWKKNLSLLQISAGILDYISNIETTTTTEFTKIIKISCDWAMLHKRRIFYVLPFHGYRQYQQSLSERGGKIKWERK